MDTKQLMTALLIIAGAFVTAILIVLGIFTYYPETLGLSPKKSKLDSLALTVDTIITPPTVSITKERMDELMDYRMQKFRLRSDRDSLLSASDKLIDSLNKLQELTKAYIDSVKSSREVRDSVLAQKRALLDSLNIVNKELKSKVNEIEKTRQRISSQEEFITQKQDSTELENFKTYAKMYNNTNPAEVAKILEQIDERDASQILKLMQTKKAGKVLEAMRPERAAAIMLLGTNEW